MTGKQSVHRARRGLATAGLAVAMVTLFAALAGIGFASGSSSASQYQYGHGQYGKKVTICHKGKRTLKVSVNAWPAHRAHGDVEGTCAELKKKGHKSEHANAKGLEHSEQAEQHGKSGDSHGKSDDSHGKSQESHGKSHDK